MAAVAEIGVWAPSARRLCTLSYVVVPKCRSVAGFGRLTRWDSWWRREHDGDGDGNGGWRIDARSLTREQAQLARSRTNTQAGKSSEMSECWPECGLELDVETRETRSSSSGRKVDTDRQGLGI